MNKFKTVLLCMLSICFLTFCSNINNNSAPNGKKGLASEIKERSNGLIELVEFQKTNAIQTNSHYKLEYDAVIKYKDDCWKPNSIINGPFGAYSNKDDATSAGEGVSPVKMKKGNEVELSGVLTFEKTENGWRFKNNRN